MPTITKITEQKRRKNRRSVYVDGKFAFGCNVNVVAKFRLVEGMAVTGEMLTAIEQGELRQECFDRAMKALERRLHSRAELAKKLARDEYPPELVGRVLDQLEELGYVNDQRFAETRAESAARHKHHGQNRARMELAKRGVDRETARQAIENVYDQHDSAATARDLASRKMRSLSSLEPAVARRRLYGMLLRRGFDYDTIKPVVEEVLGSYDEPAAE
jgi:regulatory protein